MWNVSASVVLNCDPDIDDTFHMQSSLGAKPVLQQTGEEPDSVEKRFRRILTNAPDISWTSDLDGQTIYISPKVESVLGYTKEEFCTAKQLRMGRIHPEDSKRVHAAYEALFRKQSSFDVEYRFQRKDGLWIWVQDRATTIHENKGILYADGFLTDISRRKEAERELRLTQFSVDHASDAIQWLDAKGRIVYANDAACAATRRAREELIGLSIWDISPSVSKEQWGTLWNQLKSKTSMTFESQLQTKSGEVVQVEISASYLMFDMQEYCFTFARDISERRSLESQLRQAQKLEGIGHLAAGIAHEINTPTQFVTDNLSFMQDSWKSAYELLERYRSTIRDFGGSMPENVREQIAEAEQACDLEFISTEFPRAIEQSLDGARRVAKIVRAMKEFSHPDSAEKTATDLNRAIESTITVARNEWKYVSELVTDFDSSIPAVVCYPGDINQVVLNLIVNAAHAIKERVKEGEKGRITLRTRNREEFVEISVEDTGAGIPAAIQGKVFDPFFTTKEVGKGTGQGLSFSYTVVVKKHGGKIWFETEVGKGTTFYFTLPTSVEAAIGET
jgi:two-component system, NtrC family, sensor kinase